MLGVLYGLIAPYSREHLGVLYITGTLLLPGVLYGVVASYSRQHLVVF